MTVDLRIGLECQVCMERLEARTTDANMNSGDDDRTLMVKPHRCDPKHLRQIAEDDGVADPDELYAELAAEAGL